MVKVTVSFPGGGMDKMLSSRIPAASRELQRAVIASCEPFVPYRTGELCRSAEASGTGMQGTVVYTASHAARCYYAERPFSRKVHPQACARWFEAAKAADLGLWRQRTAAVLAEKGGRPLPERDG